MKKLYIAPSIFAIIFNLLYALSLLITYDLTKTGHNTIPLILFGTVGYLILVALHMFCNRYARQLIIAKKKYVPFSLYNAALTSLFSSIITYSLFNKSIGITVIITVTLFIYIFALNSILGVWQEYAVLEEQRKTGEYEKQFKNI